MNCSVFTAFIVCHVTKAVLDLSIDLIRVLSSGIKYVVLSYLFLKTLGLLETAVVCRIILFHIDLTRIC